MTLSNGNATKVARVSNGNDSGNGNSNGKDSVTIMAGFTRLYIFLTGMCISSECARRVRFCRTDWMYWMVLGTLSAHDN